MADIPKDLQERVDEGVALEREFANQMALAKAMETRIKSFWKDVEKQMIDNDIKKISGNKEHDWGSLTIAERIKWQTTDELPSKFIKKVVDTKKLSDTFKLEGKEPKGATHSYTKYLLRRLK